MDLTPFFTGCVVGVTLFLECLLAAQNLFPWWTALFHRSCVTLFSQHLLAAHNLLSQTDCPFSSSVVWCVWKHCWQPRIWCDWQTAIFYWLRVWCFQSACWQPRTRYFLNGSPFFIGCVALFSERLLAAQNPLSLTDRPHQLFADAPPPPMQPPGPPTQNSLVPPPPPPTSAGAAPLPGMPPPPQGQRTCSVCVFWLLQQHAESPSSETVSWGPCSLRHSGLWRCWSDPACSKTKRLDDQTWPFIAL